MEIEDQDKCTQCIECFRYAESKKLNKAVEITENDFKFIFTVESTGVLPPIDIVKKALRILKSKIERFRGEMKDSAMGAIGGYYPQN